MGKNLQKSGHRRSSVVVSGDAAVCGNPYVMTVQAQREAEDSISVSGSRGTGGAQEEEILSSCANPLHHRRLFGGNTSCSLNLCFEELGLTFIVFTALLEALIKGLKLHA